MKKYAKLLSLAVALCLVLGLASTAYASMPDVNSHWAQASVEKWVDSGLAKGYPDGTFKPDNNITRAEFVALLNRAFTVQGNSAGAAFADVAEGDWYYTDVCAATSAGYVKGYEDNTFGPNKAITRAEAAAIVSRLLGITADDDSVLDKFSDAAAISDWAKADVAAMVEANLLSGYPDGTFGPARLITRAESIVTLDRSMGYKAEEVPVTGVKLDVSNFTLKVDGTKQLEATVMPANASLKAVTWKSGNEKVATVDDNGKVKAIGTGNTTITVTTLDGNKTATCNVAVIRTSGGGGGGSSGTTPSTPTWDEVVADVKTVSDPIGNTVVTVFIKDAYASMVTGVTVDGKVANKKPGTNEYRVTIEGLKVVKDLDIAVAKSNGGPSLDKAIADVKTVLDPVGNTVVTVFIKDDYALMVTGVTVDGKVANKKPGTNEYRATLEGVKQLDDLKIVVSKSGEIVDKSALNNAIISANGKVAAAVAGDAPGNYPQGAVDAYEVAINNAERVMNNAEITQEQVDVALTMLNEATTTFEAAKIPFSGDEVFKVVHAAITPPGILTLSVQLADGVTATSVKAEGLELPERKAGQYVLQLEEYAQYKVGDNITFIVETNEGETFTRDKVIIVL